MILEFKTVLDFGTAVAIIGIVVGLVSHYRLTKRQKRENQAPH